VGVMISFAIGFSALIFSGIMFIIGFIVLAVKLATKKKSYYKFKFFCIRCGTHSYTGRGYCKKCGANNFRKATKDDQRKLTLQ
jgi:rRNA maturation endonuclease Nob1